MKEITLWSFVFISDKDCKNIAKEFGDSLKCSLADYSTTNKCQSSMEVAEKTFISIRLCIGLGFIK